MNSEDVAATAESVAVDMARLVLQTQYRHTCVVPSMFAARHVTGIAASLAVHHGLILLAHPKMTRVGSEYLSSFLEAQGCCGIACASLFCRNTLTV